MLDIILIQHITSGLNLVEYSQVDTKFNMEHSDIFSGFMNAIQSISQELDIGTVVLISTKGSKGHHCIIVPHPPINVVILADQDDPIELWRGKGEIIAEEFIKNYGNDFEPSIVSTFKDFKEIIKNTCARQKYSE